MCGIVGYVGHREATPILLEGLSKLEYRGYDSAGVAVLSDNEIKAEKTKGRLKVLSDQLDGGKALKGNIGIGHTRWATHGAPSDVNSHPHLSGSGKFAVVHNGIIENYIPLREKMMRKGFTFRSETDTEVIAHMMEYYFKGDVLEAIQKVIERVEGSYALGILYVEDPDTLYAVRKDSPLIVGLGEGENFIASDIPAILEHTRDTYLLEDKEIVALSASEVKVYNMDSEPVQKEVFHVDWDVNAAEKGGYEHFMLKEIYEQAKVMQATISPRIKDGKIVLDEIELSEETLKGIEKIYVVACGTAAYAGMVGKTVIESLARIPVEVVFASEFRYSNPIMNEKTMVIVVSQSGETADTLAGLREAKRQGAQVFSIVNVVGSSIARESENVLYTWAGPEIAVASTKAYNTQCAAFYLIGLYMAKALNRIDDETYNRYIKELERLPELIEKVLLNKEQMQFFASKFYAAKDIYFLGRGIDYALAFEGSLKLKEISYIHADAYAAGELKHGPIALIEEGVPVFALATQPHLFDKMLSNIKEVKARGAVVVALAFEGNTEIEKEADYVVYIPKVEPIFASSIAVIPLQLFAYYVANAKGCDVDKPRNLAKSVTVE